MRYPQQQLPVTIVPVIDADGGRSFTGRKKTGATIAQAWRGNVIHLTDNKFKGFTPRYQQA